MRKSNQYLFISLLMLLLSVVLYGQAQENSENPLQAESTEEVLEATAVIETANPIPTLVPIETTSPEVSETQASTASPETTAEIINPEATTPASESTEVAEDTETSLPEETVSPTETVSSPTTPAPSETVLWQSLSLAEPLDNSWTTTGEAERILYENTQDNIVLRLNNNFQAIQAHQILGIGANLRFNDLSTGLFFLGLGNTEERHGYQLYLRGDGQVLLLDDGQAAQTSQVSLDTNAWHSLKLLVLNDQVTVYWEETVLFTYQDANSGQIQANSFGGQGDILVKEILWYEAMPTEDENLVNDLFADMGNLYWGSTRTVSTCGTEHRWAFYIPNDGTTQRWIVDIQPDSGNLPFGLILKDSAGVWLQNTHSSYNGRGIISSESGPVTGTFYLHLTPDSTSCFSYHITIWQNSIPRLSFAWTQDSYSNIRRWTYYLDTTYSHSVTITRTAGNIEWSWRLVVRSTGQELAQGRSVRGYSLLTTTLGSGDYDLYLSFDAGTAGSYNAAIVQGILPPAAPLIISPNQNAMLNSSNVQVQLSPGASNGRGNNFQVQADDQSNFSSPLVTSSLTSSTNITLNISQSGTLYLRARQLDNEGRASAWSGTVTIYLSLNDYINQAFRIPSVPFSYSQSIAGMSSSPTDPSNICGSAPYKTVWYSYTASSSGILYAATNGSDYDTVLALYRGTEGSLSQVACNDDDGDGLNSQLSVSVIAGTNYYLLIGSYGAAPSSGNLQLQVQYSPTHVPRLISPADNTVIGDTTPQFCWTAVTNARYQIEINGTVYPLGTSNCYTPTLPLIQGTITWRVRALNSLGQQSPWSGRNSFQLSAPLGAAPDLWRFTSDPTIYFERITWASQYHAQVSTNSSFSNIVYENNAIPTSQNSITLVGLSEGRYVIRFRARNAAGSWSAWGSTFTFTIDR